jgi:regulatory protein
VEESPLSRARARALRLLAARPRTESELRARLARAGFEAEAGEVVGWLRGLGYLDDAGYARDRARSLLAPGRLGPRLAERRLRTAGVPAEVAQRAVAEALLGDGAEGPPAAAEAAERDRCRILAERRARRPVGELDARERARLGRFLLGRGFSGECVAAVLGVYVDGGGER